MEPRKKYNIDDLVPNNIRNIMPYKPGKPVEELERELGITDSVKLASNENPLGSSPLAVEAVKNFFKDVNRYPESSGYYLRKKLADRIGEGVTMDHLILGNGSCELIDVIARVFLAPGDEAVIADPSFVMYDISIQFIGAQAVKDPCTNHTHNLETMLGRITPRTKLVYIANPNNPTGTIVDEDQFSHFMKEVPDHVMVVVDEAYREYIMNTNYPVTLPHVLDGKKLLILRTFSKIYGLAGFRIGYGIADPYTIQYMNKVRHPFNTNSLSQVAAMAALDDEEHVRRSVEVNNTGKQFLYASFDELPLKYTETWANFILVELDVDAQDVFQRLLRHGVIVRPVGGYGLKNALRITIGTESENRRLVEAMRAVLLPSNEN